MPSQLQVDNIKHSNGTNALVIDSGGQVQFQQINPLVTLGNNTTFPIGHTIGHEIIYLNDMLGSNIQTSETGAFHNSGISGTYTPKANSSASFLIIELNASMAYQDTAAGNGQTLVTMRTSDTTTYAANDSVSNKDSYQHYLRHNDTAVYGPYHCRWVFKASTSNYPVNLTSYSAGTTYHFRIYIFSSSGTFRIAHISSSLMVSVQEIML